MLMEVLRKLWTGLIVDQVTSALQRHSNLSLSQHGYLPHHGKDKAILQLLNTLESAWEKRKPLYGCSWDMSKTFDSVSKPLIVLYWQRLGLPVEIGQWLVNLDASGYTIVRTPYAHSKWDGEGLDGLRDISFNPERGTGQGDIHSPFTGLAVFDVLLTSTCLGQSIHASAPRCLPLARQAHLLYRRPPAICLVAVWATGHCDLGLCVCHGLQSLECCSQAHGVPLLWTLSTTR